MGKIIAVVNQKGGVGKTVTCSTLAAVLTDRGYKVLSISMDPQENLDMIAGKAIDMNDTKTPSMLQALQGRCSIKDCIVSTPIGDLARASTQMSQWVGYQGFNRDEYMAVRDSLPDLQKFVEDKIEQGEQAVRRLREILYPIVDSYQFIFIDPNPALTVLTLNSIFAADYLIVPAQADLTSFRAIQELCTTVTTLDKFDPERPPTKYLGILMTRCQFQTNGYKFFSSFYAKYAKIINSRLFNTRIRQATRVTEITRQAKDLLHYDPRGTATQDYIAFADEFLRLMEGVQ